MPQDKVQQIIFAGGQKPPPERPDYDSDDRFEEIDKRDTERKARNPDRPSAYVKVFEDMINLVLDHEPHLFSSDEVNAIEHFTKLNYKSRYCLVKLVLRKANAWHPLSAMETYKQEVGEADLVPALNILCKPLPNKNTEPLVKTESMEDIKLEPSETLLPPSSGPEVIDLTMDSDDEGSGSGPPPLPQPSHLSKTLHNIISNQAGPSYLPLKGDPIQMILESDPSMMTLDYFCENETAMSTHEVLGRLTKDVLLKVAKQLKCKVASSQRKEEIINALEQQAAGQSVLNFVSSSKKGKGRDDGMRQTQLDMFMPKAPNITRKQSQEQRLRDIALEKLGPCYRVNFDFYRLVRRLHIVCFRETEHPQQLMTPALLSIFKKRVYPQYDHKRAQNVWLTRQDLLNYEIALEINQKLEEILQEQPEKVSKRATKTPAFKRETVTPAPGRSLTTPIKTPLKTPGGVANCPETPTLLDWGELPGDVAEDKEEAETVEIRKEIKVKKHLYDWILPKWREYLATENEGPSIRPPGFERFDAGHVFTRMVHKGSKMLGPLKDFAEELRIMDELLDQRFWCRGKRATWYTRRAILLKHMRKNAVDKNSIDVRILDGVRDALLDTDTGMVSRPGLVKRLMAIEKSLKVPELERSTCDGELKPPPEVVIIAERIHPPQFDRNGDPIEKENTPELHRYLNIQKEIDVTDEAKTPKRPSGKKSSWKGRNDEIVNVETRALQDYEDKGYKGFHAETRILTTLFGLLFWDVIFADVDGAFDTKWQYAPLDLCHDSFNRARKTLIEKRLQELRDGQGPGILRKHDEAYRDKSVVCAFVSWDLCPRQDLLDIIECINGKALAHICQLFCEDYQGRASGGPDLFVWNVEQRTHRFVEVKGPNDTPSENQKLWFDTLLRGGANVEICHVRDSLDSKGIGLKKGLKRKAKTPAPKRAGSIRDVESEDEDYDQLDRDKDEDDVIDIDQRAGNKRRRVSETAAATGDDFGFSTTSRVNRAQVVLTPRKGI